MSLPHSTLLDAADPLLALVPQLRQLNGQIDVGSLQREIVALVKQFGHQLTAAGVDPETRQQASYILCSLLDETVLNTAWGEHSVWSQKSLLSSVHGETYGGERIFGLLDEVLLSPGQHLDLIELMYLVLSLGFMGKYRIHPQGPFKVEQIRSQIYELLIRSKDDHPQELSPSITPVAGLKNRIFTFLPVWMLWAVLLLGGFAVYSYQLMSLNELSDATVSRVAALVPHGVMAVAEANEPHPEAVRLMTLLAPEIERGLIRIDHYMTHTSITLSGGELFASGTDELNEMFNPVLDKIAMALETTTGRIMVTGHTDNQAIRTTRFPSNWHLSLARASAVSRYLGHAGDLTGRLLPEGRGDTEPVVSNETAEGRASNRRVVIDVYHQNVHARDSIENPAGTPEAVMTASEAENSQS
ncbi:type VI secretion system protein TssL, long form [Oceanobacter mangrovi]|uniref:type VI secretion system protein TssL, long form n=1 Tax=Oceanobacter mangrovi TaxID=2862510 RepID=UPI001FEBFF55|nr:type VI secretion system protein TssL, long form [Oceanobacter mangrovi]